MRVPRIVKNGVCVPKFACISNFGGNRKCFTPKGKRDEFLTYKENFARWKILQNQNFARLMYKLRGTQLAIFHECIVVIDDDLFRTVKYNDWMNLLNLLYLWCTKFTSYYPWGTNHHFNFYRYTYSYSITQLY